MLAAVFDEHRRRFDDDDWAVDAFVRKTPAALNQAAVEANPAPLVGHPDDEDLISDDDLAAFMGELDVGLPGV